VRFDLAVDDFSEIQRLAVKWNGHGEPTPGYPTELYLWENDAGWVQEASKVVGTDGDLAGMRSAVAQQACLSCHDGEAPQGIVVPADQTNIGQTWQTDIHGAGLASALGTGPLLGAYARDSRAIDCTACHATHGSQSIYHIPESVNGTSSVSVTSGSQMGSLCRSCHGGGLETWHASCVDCHSNGHWAGWVDPPVENKLPGPTSDCTQCHGHGQSWTHPATCLRCHGVTELRNLHATPDQPWTYERTF
jgi:hypothetical protein